MKAIQFFYENSLFQGMNSTFIAQERENDKDLPLFNKVQKGIYSGAKVALKVWALGIGLLLINNGSLSIPPNPWRWKAEVLLNTLVFEPIFEEIAFRGIVQNCLFFLPSAALRIFLINTYFSLGHLGNCPYHALVFSLYPIESALHETTGNLAAPLAAHIAGNAVSVALTGCLEILNQLF